MSSEIDSIVTGYQSLGLTPEQIAEDRSLDIVSVKAALMQHSKQYRQDMGLMPSGDENKLDFTDDDLSAVNNVIRTIAIFGEDEHLKLKAAIYIRDDKKGRREIVKAIGGGNTFNIMSFNESMQRAREMAQKKVVNV